MIPPSCFDDDDIAPRALWLGPEPGDRDREAATLNRLAWL